MPTTGALSTAILNNAGQSLATSLSMIAVSCAAGVLIGVASPISSRRSDTWSFTEETRFQSFRYCQRCLMYKRQQYLQLFSGSCGCQCCFLRLWLCLRENSSKQDKRSYQQVANRQELKKKGENSGKFELICVSACFQELALVWRFLLEFSLYPMLSCQRRFL